MITAFLVILYFILSLLATLWIINPVTYRGLFLAILLGPFVGGPVFVIECFVQLLTLEFWDKKFRGKED